MRVRIVLEGHESGPLRKREEILTVTSLSDINLPHGAFGHRLDDIMAEVMYVAARVPEALERKRDFYGRLAVSRDDEEQA